MAEKSSMWLKESGATGEPLGVQPNRFGFLVGSSKAARIIQTLLIVGVVAMFTEFVLKVTDASWAWEAMRLIAVSVVLLGLFNFRNHYVKPAYVIWYLLLISECIFFREGDMFSNAYAYEGKFPVAVYSEVLNWILIFLAILLFSNNLRAYVFKLFKGDYKWPTLFALVSIFSCIYAPRVAFGLAWSFKLSTAVLLLVLCSDQIHEFKDLISFLRFTVWAYLIVVLTPVVLSTFTGQMFDEEGRMSTIVSPNALSPNAGCVLLLALALFSKRKDEGMNKSAILLGLVACVIMILAGSKTGILAAVFAGALFYLLRGRFGSAFSYIAATAVLVSVLALYTPLGDYFHTYEAGEGATTFSGRTILWAAVLPKIIEKPILGHGYLATTFLEFQVNAVGWGAPHLHNGFLEVLYNSGIIGLIFVLGICYVIPRNLIRVLRRASSASAPYRIAAGCMALYVFLIINGFFNSSFGGKASAPFMLLLSLIVVSHKLQEFVSRPVEKAELTRLDPSMARVGS